MIAGAAFIIGAILQASSKDTIAMIYIGRIFWGFGVGFGDHCAFICASPDPSSDVSPVCCRAICTIEDQCAHRCADVRTFRILLTAPFAQHDDDDDDDDDGPSTCMS